MPSTSLAEVPSNLVSLQPIAIASSANGHAKTALEPEILTHNLLELVSERTGYPTEVLGLE